MSWTGEWALAVRDRNVGRFVRERENFRVKDRIELSFDQIGVWGRGWIGTDGDAFNALFIHGLPPLDGTCIPHSPDNNNRGESYVEYAHHVEYVYVHLYILSF